MKAIVDLALGVVDLLEAEARQLRRGVVRAASSIAMLWASAVLVLTGMGFVLAAIYLLLSMPLPPWGAALITGGIALVLAAVVMGVARWMSH